MSIFNNSLSLMANIKGGLWVNAKTLDDMASELEIKKSNIVVAVSKKFKRNESIPPQNKKMIAYLQSNCKGFKAYCKANGIKLIGGES